MNHLIEEQDRPHASSSTFPHFDNGDVLFYIPPSQIWNLHADVLRRCSPGYMGSLLAPHHAAKLIKAAEKAGTKTRYRLELVPSHGNPNGVFIRKNVDKWGRSAPNANDHSLFSHIYDSRTEENATECWKSLFGTFYNIEPDLAGPNLKAVLEKCFRLMDTAESMDAAVSVRPYIDNALMRHGQVLYRSILSNPLQWGDFATRLHSPTVLNDAVIHLVGKWNSLTKQEKRGMDNRLRTICERKAEQLYKIKGASEIRIAGHIPKACWRDASRDTISRVSYSNDVYMWMAIAIHHQWFHQVVGIERRGRDSPDGGAMLYKAIWEGNTSYLNAQDYANFHNLCPMSNKARTILYDKIRQMKSEVRRYVKNLVSNKTQLDLDALDAGEPIDHLLCTEMTLEDHPWNDPDSEAFVPPAFSDDEDDDEVEMEGGIPPGVAAHTFQTAFHPPSSEQTVEHS